MSATTIGQTMKGKKLLMDRDDYWYAMQQNVCIHCIDGDRDGNCHLDTNRQCPLKTHLGSVITTVNRVSSVRIEDYIEQLHVVVCDDCKYQKKDGTCTKRVKEDCALDTYFPLFIDSIEEVAQKNVD